jgi:tetratricopeptide (TPR) repeat protein
MKFIIPLLIFSFFITACAPAINRKTSQITSEAGAIAQQNGDWDAARRNFAKALLNAEMGNEPKDTLAILNYEYGRSLGVTCFFEKAEFYLEKSLELDQQTNGPIYLSILELARLNFDQKRYEAAIPYFEKLLPIYKDINAEKEAPYAVAEVFDEYSVALGKTGNMKKAESIKQKAITLRAQYPGGYSVTDRTPYGTQCVQKSP